MVLRPRSARPPDLHAWRRSPGSYRCRARTRQACWDRRRSDPDRTRPRSRHRSPDRRPSGNIPVALLSKQPGKVFVGSQPACSQPVLATLQVSWRSKHPGKGCVASHPACSQPVLMTVQLSSRSKQPGKGCVGSHPACSQPVLTTVQVSWLSKQPGKARVGSQPACSQPVLATGQGAWLSKQAKVTGSQPACSQPVFTTGQLITGIGCWFVAVPPTESVLLVWLNDVPSVSGYLALTATNPFTMSWSRTVYVTPVSGSGNDVGAPRHCPRPPLLAEFGSFVVPPTHGTFVGIVWLTPSGVVNVRVPPSKAQVGTLVV